MLPMGDFETVFSFTHDGMCDLFSRSFNGYRASVMVPELDWKDRGLPENEFDTPVQDNLRALYDVMHSHTARYINIYYDSDAALRRDETVMAWVAALNKQIPNGIGGVTGGTVTRENLALLAAGFIYMASVQLEALGSCMWNYQMWVDKNPVRIHTNGQRVPIDVFQRLLNANFNLNVDRAKLLQDLSYFALDDAGAGAFRLFLAELHALDRELKGKAYATWRITPSMLEANINA
jgi:arachidonate 15-lipoxygenase